MPKRFGILRVVLFLFLVLLAAQFTPVNAISVFSKNSANPVISPSLDGWDNVHTWQPNVIYDGTEFKMWYTGGNTTRTQIGLAHSTDGINWIKDPNYPIITRLSLDNRDAHNPSVLFNGSSYEMWYSSSANWTDWAIQRATSNDGVSWTNDPIAPVFQPSEGWGIGVALAQSVIKVGNEYKMWFTSNDGRWKIGYATSPDGINWTSYSGNPVISPTGWEGNDAYGPTVLYDGTTYEVFYHNDAGITYATSSDGISWGNKILVLQPSAGFDVGGVQDPSVLRLPNGTTLLYYSGFDPFARTFRIGLAADGPIEIPAGEPTPTPTPTPASLSPIVIIPGMMASWNKEAILEGQTNPSTSWSILPFVSEYSGLVQTLKDLGYTENQNLFLWPYDWRKPVGTIQANFDNFLTNTVKPANPGQQLNLIGHSLGGLVARAWTQSGTNQSDVSHLITAGTPHEGAVQVYKAWSGGELPQQNTLMWLAQRMILELNRQAFATNRETLRSMLPVLEDILPTTAYLTRQSDNQLIDPAAMTATNAWLTNLNTGVAPLFPVFDALAGTSFTTPDGYTVTPPSWLDTALGNWADGKPVAEQTTDNADGTVTQSRATIDGDPSTTLNQNHGNTIASAEGIDAILDSLSLPHTAGDITAGTPTTVTPGALFLLRSPATLRVLFNGTTYEGPEGIVFIPGAQNGSYSVELTGTGSGSYTLVTAQISQTTSVWKQYTGTITPGATRIYSLSLSTTEPSPDPAAATNSQRLDEMDQLLAALGSNSYLTQARRTLQLARSYLSKNRYAQVKTYLETVLTQLSLYRKSQTNEANINASLALSEKIIDLYHQALSAQSSLFPIADVTRMATTTASYETNVTNRLLSAASSGQNITRKSQRFVSGQSYRMKAAEDNSAGRRAKARATFLLSQLLFREAL